MLGLYRFFGGVSFLGGLFLGGDGFFLGGVLGEGLRGDGLPPLVAEAGTVGRGVSGRVEPLPPPRIALSSPRPRTGVDLDGERGGGVRVGEGRPVPPPRIGLPRRATFRPVLDLVVWP